MSDNKTAPSQNKKLPWIIAAAAVIVFLVTLNHWMTLVSLPVVGKIGGWYWWTPDLGQPLNFLVTLPFKALSPAARPLALNILSAIFAALTLAQLARSVSLLPQDRTRDQRQRELHPQGLLSMKGRWLPVLLAVGLCGMQLTFWEHATVYTGQMLDLLLFAFVIRCLLEHRLASHLGWLRAALLVYGFGIANNWGMIGFLPLFVIAVVWIEGAALFTGKRFLKTVGLGSVGLLLYLLLPAIRQVNDTAEASFWEMIRHHIQMQKNSVLSIPNYILVILSLSSLFPLLSMSIKWPSNAGDTNPLAQVLANFTFHLIHAMFLGLCVWVFFDPFISPRAVGKGLPYLSFYYLSALCAGYYAGYFLIICAKVSDKKWQKPSILTKGLRAVMLFTIWIGTFVAPVSLAWINSPKIAAGNTDEFVEFAEKLAASLPEDSAVVMSSQPELLVLAAAALDRLRSKNDHIFIDVRYLNRVQYHERMARRNPEKWPAEWDAKQFPHGIHPALPPRMIAELAVKHGAFFLHPVAGRPYLEFLYLRQIGLVYRLHPHSGETVTIPPRSTSEIAAARQRWATVKPSMENVIAQLESKSPQINFASGWYSAHVNFHGVEQQRSGDLESAAEVFETALRLKPSNQSARLNAAFNESRRTDKPLDLDLGQWLGDIAAQFGAWNSLVMLNGPVDAPTALYVEALAYGRLGLSRQAAIRLIRARDLEPENLKHYFALAENYLRASDPDKVFATVAEIRKRVPEETMDLLMRLEITRLEAMAYHAKKDFPKAEAMLLAAKRDHPDAGGILRALSNLYIVSDQMTNARASLEGQLTLNPDDTHALQNLGAVELRLKDAKAALAALDRLVKLQPKNASGRINRAQAYLALDRQEEATRDLERARSLQPSNAQAPLFLAKIAIAQNDIPSAKENLRAYLQIAPPGAPEVKPAMAELERLNNLSD